MFWFTLQDKYSAARKPISAQPRVHARMYSSWNIFPRNVIYSVVKQNIITGIIWQEYIPNILRNIFTWWNRALVVTGRFRSSPSGGGGGGGGGAAEPRRLAERPIRAPHFWRAVLCSVFGCCPFDQSRLCPWEKYTHPINHPWAFKNHRNVFYMSQGTRWTLKFCSSSIRSKVIGDHGFSSPFGT